MDKTDLLIRPMAGAPEFAGQTAALMAEIWPDHYGPDGIGDATGDVAARMAEDRGAVAIIQGRVIGTVALAKTSFGAQSGEGPWMIGLCCAVDQRNQGVGSALTLWAMDRGAPQLFATTRAADGLFGKLGWQPVRQVKDDALTWTVWRYGAGT